MSTANARRQEDQTYPIHMKKPTTPKSKKPSAEAIKKADQALDARVKADMTEMQTYATAALTAILSNSELITAVSIYAKDVGHPEKVPSYLADSAWGYAMSMLNARQKVETAIKGLYKNGQPFPGEDGNPLSAMQKFGDKAGTQPKTDLHGNN